MWKLTKLINNRTKFIIVYTLFFFFLVSCATTRRAPNEYQNELYVTEKDIGQYDIGDITNQSVTYATSIWPKLIQGFQLKADTSNKYYRYYIDRFRQKPQYLQQKMRHAHYYLYYILNEVKRRNMPTELALLPIVESQYESLAYSSARASGMWQIIPDTARHLRLSMNWWYDERRDVRLATNAALNYLQNLYYLLGDWLLAIAAYNAGPGTINKAIKKSGSKDFWQLDLPAETEDYVPKLLGIAHAVKNNKKFNVQLPLVANKPYFVTIQLGAPIHLKQLAQEAGLPFSVLEKLNPGYNQWITPPRPNNFVLVPHTYLPRIKTALQTLAGNRNFYWLSYKVKSGDSLPAIAKKHYVSIEDIVNVNHLAKSKITKGQLLLIPVPADKVSNEMIELSESESKQDTKTPGPNLEA